MNRREERQEQLRRFDAWAEAHPWLAFSYGIGVVILTTELGLLLLFGIQWLVKGR